MHQYSEEFKEWYLRNMGVSMIEAHQRALREIHMLEKAFEDGRKSKEEIVSWTVTSPKLETQQILSHLPELSSLKLDVPTELDIVLNKNKYGLGIGDLVCGKHSYPLRSGYGEYSNAVVVCADPFILVTLGMDMCWRSVDPSLVEKVGEVSYRQLRNCQTKLSKTELILAGYTEEKAQKFLADAKSRTTFNAAEDTCTICKRLKQDHENGGFCPAS